MGAIQSDAALRQSTEGRQIVVLLAILEAAPEIRVPFRVDSHHSSKLGGKSQGGRHDRNQPYRESPQRECITLDRTPCIIAWNLTNHIKGLGRRHLRDTHYLLGQNGHAAGDINENDVNVGSRLVLLEYLPCQAKHLAQDPP
jgi:hypothetical protein